MLPLSTKVLMAISVLPEGPPRVGTDRDRMGAIEQAESCAGRYVLASDDGRMVTYDTRTGPGLTASQADATFMGRQVPLCICVGDVLYERLGFSKDGFTVLDDPNAESEPERGVFTLKDIFDIKYVVHKNAIYGKKVEA